MSRTFGKISFDGKELTDFVPIRIISELGMSTGHARVPQHISMEFKSGRYTLKLKDCQEFKIQFSGVSGPKVYFYTVDEEVGGAVAVMA